MGYRKVDRRPVLRSGERVQPIQALTGASTATRVKNYGITTIIVTTGEGSSTSCVYTMDNPVPGVKKTLLVQTNKGSSTKVVTVKTPSSLSTILGTTKNAVSWAVSSTYAAIAVELLGITTAQWAVISPVLAQSTAVNTWKISIIGATA